MTSTWQFGQIEGAGGVGNAGPLGTIFWKRGSPPEVDFWGGEPSLLSCGPISSPTLFALQGGGEPRPPPDSLDISIVVVTGRGTISLPLVIDGCFRSSRASTKRSFVPTPRRVSRPKVVPLNPAALGEIPANGRAEVLKSRVSRDRGPLANPASPPNGVPRDKLGRASPGGGFPPPLGFGRWGPSVAAPPPEARDFIFD